MTGRSGSTALLVITVLNRTATAMVPLAVLLRQEEVSSLAFGSVVLAAWTILGALSQPLWIRAMARLDPRAVLVVTGLVSALATACINASGRGVAAAAGALAGLFLPPVTPLTRSAIAAAPDRKRLFALESSIVSSAYVIAPLLVGAARFVHPDGALILIGVPLFVSSAATARLRLSTSTLRTEEEVDRTPAGRSGRRTVLLLVLAGTSAYGALAVFDVTVVARIDGDRRTAFVIAGSAVLSTVSGILFSRVASHPRAVRPALWSTVVGGVLLLALSSTQLGFAITFVIAGAAIAPVLTLITTAPSDLLPAAALPRVYAQLNTASWIGSAGATAIAGPLAEHHLAWALVLSLVLWFVIIPLFGLVQRSAAPAVECPASPAG